MKKLFIAFLFVALIVVAMIPIGQLLYPDDDVGELMIPRSELGGMTLHEVFVENGVSLRDIQLLYNADMEEDYPFTCTDCTFTIDEGIATITNTGATGSFNLAYMWMSGDSYYTYASVRSASNTNVRLYTFENVYTPYYSDVGRYEVLTSYGPNGLGFSVEVINSGGIGSKMYVDYVYLFRAYDLSNGDYSTLYSDLFDDTFDNLTPSQYKYQFDEWMKLGINTINPFLSYSKANITTLNESQMLYWYDYYIQLTA